ncbi:SCP-related protein precursor [Danaus plexippus plexippus]|uniref:SCP-related protein n=1 Tax=Danaus plexippus plexippus TaxID=278856 RepID=A0A212EQ99_DANPL|nr:SCP-related protein precursor [Danaus plexippus plexippus]
MYLKVISFFFLIHNVFSDEIVLNCDNIREFVDGHNDRRLKLAKGEVENQPPASEMQYLIWDHELEDKAVKWAAHYTTEHESDDTLSSGRFQINQNTLKIVSSEEDYKMAQSKAKYIGCGMSERDEDGWKAFYVVCNYGPSNEKYKSQEPYSTSAPNDQLEYDPEEYEHRYGYTCQ